MIPTFRTFKLGRHQGEFMSFWGLKIFSIFFLSHHRNTWTICKMAALNWVSTKIRDNSLLPIYVQRLWWYLPFQLDSATFTGKLATAIFKTYLCSNVLHCSQICLWSAIVYWTGRYSSPSSLPIDLRYASNCNIRLRIPQTEIYSLKIKASKKRCRCFHSHTSKIGLSEIHFQDL